MMKAFITVIRFHHFRVLLCMITTVQEKSIVLLECKIIVFIDFKPCTVNHFTGFVICKSDGPYILSCLS